MQSTAVCVGTLKINYINLCLYIFVQVLLKIFYFRDTTTSGFESALYCEADDIVWLFAFVLQIKFILNDG